MTKKTGVVLAAIAIAATILVIKGKPEVRIIKRSPQPEPPKPLTLEKQFNAWKAKLQAQLKTLQTSPRGK